MLYKYIPTAFLSGDEIPTAANVSSGLAIKKEDETRLGVCGMRETQCACAVSMYTNF